MVAKMFLRGVRIPYSDSVKYAYFMLYCL